MKKTFINNIVATVVFVALVGFSYGQTNQVQEKEKNESSNEECSPCEEARKNNKAVSQLAPTNLSQKDKEKYQIDYSRIDENLSEEERNKEIHRLKNEMLLRQENDAKLQRDK